MTAPAAEWGAATMPRDGESVAGDRYLVHEDAEGLLIAAVDGVGHGREAATAAEAAIHVFESEPNRSLSRLLERCHVALQGTRGAVVLLARYDSRRSRLEWAGVGPILGIVSRHDAARRPRNELLLTRTGMLGHGTLWAPAASTAISAGDMLVLTTDGVSSGFLESLSPSDSPARLARHILESHRKTDDDAMVLVVRFRSSDG